MILKTRKTNKVHYKLDVGDTIDIGDITYNEYNEFINAQIRKPLIETIEDVEHIENLLVEVKKKLTKA